MLNDRRLWTSEEDQHIIRLVSKYGTKKWPTISEKLFAETELERTGKQCRQRWYNHLNPEINSSIWRQQDEERLFEAHKKYGNKWKSISKQFVGRTDNSIKNHFYSTIRRCLRRINKLQGQKNSTLKMRNIKPYVLSKILADRNLTELILQLGKIKPNKAKKQYSSEYFNEFNEMISKLYDINKQYQQIKANKKLGKIIKSEYNIENIDEKSQSDVKSQHLNSLRLQKSTIEIERVNEIRQECLKIDELYNEKVVKKDHKKVKRIIKRFKKHDNMLRQISQFKIEGQKSNPQKRYRKPINYMKLNDGILCESRHEGEDINHPSQLKTKTLENVVSLQNLSINQFDSENQEEIIEEQSRSIQKYNNQNNFFNHDYQLNPLGAIHNLSNPSPCFSKHFNSFDDLIIIGTHLKLCSFHERNSSEYFKVDQTERKKSQEEFIEEILQINFDPSQALRGLDENYQSQQSSI